ncbi:hypothetical protein LINGRAHAP2_LOCUS14191, partial [Linum grandiflorum]
MTFRFRIQLEVYDETRGVEMVLLDRFSETMLGTTAQSLHQQNGNDSSTLPQIITTLLGKNFKAQVQVNDYNIRTGRNEYTITKIVDGPKEKQTHTKEDGPGSPRTSQEGNTSTTIIESLEDDLLMMMTPQ